MKTKEFTENGIKHIVETSPVVVSEIRKSDYKDEFKAILKQTVKTTSYYPTKSVSNEFQDNIFDLEDFGITSEPYESERVSVAFLTVPEGTTVESLTKKLERFPDACVYRILSNSPILTQAQERSIKIGQKTYDDYANTQVIRSGGEDSKLVLDKNGKVQYKVVFFSSTEKADIDKRTKDPEDMYLSEELEAEYNEALLITA